MDTKNQTIIENTAQKHGLTIKNTINWNNFPKPARIGAILDHIKAINTKKIPKTWAIGSHTLDSSQDMLHYADKTTVKLTEKETALLITLTKTKGQSVTRKELLDEVWDYAENAETHTLETHIYRLRQKIEKDPENPEIIITDDEGYRLGV